MSRPFHYPVYVLSDRRTEENLVGYVRLHEECEHGASTTVMSEIMARRLDVKSSRVRVPATIAHQAESETHLEFDIVPEYVVRQSEVDRQEAVMGHGKSLRRQQKDRKERSMFGHLNRGHE